MRKRSINVVKLMPMFKYDRSNFGEKLNVFSSFLTQLFSVLRILHEHMDNLESMFLLFDEEPPLCVKEVPMEEYRGHPWEKKMRK